MANREWTAGFEATARSLADDFTKLAKHANTAASLPALTVSDQLQRLQAQGTQTLEKLQELSDQVTTLSGQVTALSSDSRMLNLQLCQVANRPLRESDELMWPNFASGTAPTAKPPTYLNVLEAPAAIINPLIEGYGLDAGGSLQTKRNALLRHIGYFKLT